jgi:hypothetical protein
VQVVQRIAASIVVVHKASQSADAANKAARTRGQRHCSGPESVGHSTDPVRHGRPKTISGIANLLDRIHNSAEV